jgi:hypothetical protein
MIRRPRRGLQDLKTRGCAVGPASESSARSAVYLKLAVLAIERERRAREHVASAARTASVEHRMVQIDAEVRSLEDAAGIGEAGAQGAPPDAAAGPTLPPLRSRIFRF